MWLFPNQCQVYGSVSNNVKKTRRDVVCILGMHKPVVITKSPGKPNLAYPVHEKCEMEEVFDGLIEECELNACKWKKGHHFCWTYDSCSELFSLFHRKLSKEITNPVGHPNASRFRLADKLTASNPLALKNVVVTLFSKPIN